jgi:transcriptional regulator with XRE-family HTH domain
MILGGEEMENNIRRVINKKGYKISYVIEKSKLSKSYFYDIMAGRSIPSLTNARKIAEVLNEPLIEIFPDTNLDKEVS